MIDETVKVRNLNKHEFKQMFKGDMIVIPAGKFVEMDYTEAVDFLGTFKTPVYLKSGVQDPKSYKMLQIDAEDRKRARAARNNELEQTEKVFVCMSCAKEFQTKSALMKHIKQKHANQMVDEDAKEELMESSFED